MKIFKSTGVILILVATLLGASSWGFLVHRTVNQLAVYELPGQLRLFFYTNMDSLVSQSVRPDERRGSDATEASKHFIDLEMYGDSAAFKMPLQWDAAVSMFTKDTLLKYGYVPYHVVYMKERLTAAFKERNADSILFYAADIGHYIADAQVPLHTSVNYDGQLTNQKGLHSLWESLVPELELANYQLSSRHKATYLRNPAEAIMSAVRHAHTLLPALFEKEKVVSQQFPDSIKYIVQMRRGRESKSYSPEFARAYAKELAPAINEQLIASSNLLADFWYTSWVDAGSPDLSAIYTANADSKKMMKKELRSFKRNNLIKNNMLLARKRAVEKTQE